MTLEELKKRYYKADVEQLTKLLGLRQKDTVVAVNGIKGSALAFIAALAAEKSPDTQLLLFRDSEEAAFFYNDMEILLNDRSKSLQEKRVLYLPSSYKRNSRWGETDLSNVKLRAEILHKLSIPDTQPLILVSYPEGVAETVVTQDYIDRKSFSVKRGEEILTDDFLNKLYELEYLPEDFVYEPGQFAWRGNIFDIFSYSEEYPIRIEFEGDCIESIRFFNPETQLSIREVDHIYIMTPISQKESESSKRVPFFAVLPENSVIWQMHAANIASTIHTAYQDIVDNAYFTADEIPIINKKTFLKEVAYFQRVYVNTAEINSPALALEFNMQPQHDFDKSFDYLLLEWIDNLEHGIQNYFLSETQSQLDRLYKVMLDILEKYNRQNEAAFKIEQLYTPICQVVHEGFTDADHKIALYTDHQFWNKFQRMVLNDRYKKSEALTLREIYDLQPGDYVTHIDHGVGVYQGLEKKQMGDSTQEVIKISYKDGDTIYLSIHALHKISKYVGKDGTPPTIHRLSSGTWEKLKERTKKRVKELAIDLIKLYSERKAKKGFAYSPDSYLQSTLESSFIYEDTPDQIKTLAEVKADMESDHPMDRLICGDVGFGKTEIAIRAAFKAVCDSKQVAVLVPTTVLSMQHYYTFSERLANMPCNIAYINRFRTTKEIKETLKRVKEGKVDILIGTHRLLSKDVVFKDLGLLIIDEEQKFGVAAKEKIREMRTTIDTLTMSATPIPRTLQFSLIGARDISVITTPPPNRQPIDTQVHVFDEDILRDAIQYELDRGGQVFVVHNKIQTIKELSGLIQRLVPKARIAIGHGQMEGDQLEKIMTQFINGDYDVLVSTTIVESGLDIVNANTMIINDAQNFALNVLHQLRGRVGRNNQKAYCYLFIKPWDTLNDQARKRLQAIEQFSDIGSGIHIALRDLDIRGAGDILGADQSGFINEMGYDMYQKILNEAIQEMKDAGDEGLGDLQMADNSALLRRECSLETDIEALFPSTYISNVTERMNLYKELESIRDPQKLEEFRKKVTDIFGPMPRETEELMQTIPLRMLAADLHFEKIILKKRTFHGYFTGNSQSRYFQSDEFGKFLLFMQANHPVVQLKEANHKLVCSIHNIPTFKAAYHWLGKMEQAVSS
ncbi:MAG: transcription-repair coupling factor [Bacteroidales bacterium]|nr:transcription-repair coupling factor [Bacteroidales bacterium]